MTDTIPRPRDRGAGADDASEPDPPLICAPLRIEAVAIRRGLRDLRDLPDPPAVIRTGPDPAVLRSAPAVLRTSSAPAVLRTGRRLPLPCYARGTGPRGRRRRPGA